jgi:hypothetical protein
MAGEFTAYDVRITRGRRRGQLARVVAHMNTNDGRRLTCKFRDGAYEMIPERNTQPLKRGTSHVAVIARRRLRERRVINSREKVIVRS